MMQRIGNILITGLLALTFLLVPVSALIEETRGQAANETAISQDYLDLSSGTVSWHPLNFPGFFYELNDELGNENLAILDSATLIGNRTIPHDKLLYSTSGDNRMLDVVKYPFNGNYTAAAQAGLIGFQAGGMSSEDGKYKAVQWQGMKWIASNNNTSVLSKLAFEQQRYDNKTLTTGETWSLGAGYELTINAIDARSKPRQVWFTLKKDGAVIDEGIVQEGRIYVIFSNNFPFFVTYADAIYSGSTSDQVRFKHTWLLDMSTLNVITIGDKYGIFTTIRADESTIEMRNWGNVSLASDSVVTLMGNLKFKVANSDTLRFYPYSYGEIRGWTANETAGQKGNLNLSSGTVSWQPQNFAGLFYELDDETGSEELTIMESTLLIDKRVIPQDKLKYSTSGDNRMLDVVKYPFNGNYTAAAQAGLIEFQAGGMSSENGKYKAVGWKGEKSIAIKNRTNKLSMPVIEHGPKDKKTLKVGDIWDIGKGWSLTVMGIDAKVKLVWFTLRKDGAIVDEIVMNQGQIYTYVRGSLAGEINVPMFVTYADAIFSGATTDLAQFKYTWAIDTNITQIRTGDLFGVFKVTGMNSSTIELRNTNYPISLDRDSRVNLMGNMGLKVADSDTLRFYPIIEAPTCQYSIINGRVFEDNNVNGLQDTGEPGIIDRTVMLKGTEICSNAIIDMKIRTNVEGYFELQNIRAGTYFLYEEIPTGWIPTTPGIYTVIIPHSSTSITEDFGNIFLLSAEHIKIGKLKGGMMNSS